MGAYQPPERPRDEHELPDVGACWVQALTLRERMSLSQAPGEEEADFTFKLLARAVITEDGEQLMDESGWDLYSASYPRETQEIAYAALRRAGFDVELEKKD